jgi:predicted Fe-Mo cluster-binding NifX family protein
MRAAFASIDGSFINQHFGSARWWQIYDIDESGGQFVETRKSPAKCAGHCEGGFSHLLELLDDCDAIFVTKIGESAAAFMIENGKRVFEAAGEVEDIVSEVAYGGI